MMRWGGQLHHNDEMGGFVLHTVDGGNYWKIQAKTNQAGIAIHFADEKQGWIVLGNGNSLLTQDGGETWVLRATTQSTNGLRRITFSSHSSAWGMGGGGAYITNDQGQNWERISVSTGEETLAVQQTVPETIDDPDEENNDDEDDATFAELLQQQFRQQLQRPGRIAPEGTIPSGDTQESTNTETQERRPAPEQRRRFGRRRGGTVASVYFLDRMNVWAVGSSGSIYHSSDGGKEWQRQIGEQQRSDIKEVLFYNNKVGWIASSDGNLSETNDGGQTWERLNIRTRQPLIGIHFTSLEPKWGWTMRRDGTVHYTTNGTVWSAGETPEQPPFIEGDPPGAYSLSDVDFGKFSEGWAVGRYGDNHT